jgi:hypothetical protein
MVGSATPSLPVPRPHKGKKHNPKKSRTKRADWDLKTEVRESLERLSHVVELHGFLRKPGGKDIDNTADYHVSLIQQMGGGPEHFLKFYKYKLAAFYAAQGCLDEPQELPPSPLPKGSDDVRTFYGGRFHRWFRHQTKEKKQAIAWSLLQGKRVVSRPPNSLLERAQREAFEDLTRSRPAWKPGFVLPLAVQEEYEEKYGPPQDCQLNQRNHNPHFKECLLKRDILSEDAAKAQLRRTVWEFFNGQSYRLSDEFKPFFPSTSANYNRTRSALGTVGEILQHPHLLKGLRASDDPEFKGIQIQERSVALRQGPLAQGGHGSDEKVYLIDSTDLERRWAELFQRAKNEAAYEWPLAEPLSLPEPIKIRTITKGPPLTNFVLKPLQQFLWSRLKQTKTCRLVGEPAKAEVIEEALGALREDELFVSGDYKSATNELRSWVSDTIADELTVVLSLDVETAVLLRRALTGHILVDPKTGDMAEQMNGQLMGSIISFPVLCLANVALCRWALEVGMNRSLDLDHVPLLVNGDDCVFRTNRFGKIAWRRICPLFGLEESIGKTYFARSFLNINSTLFNVMPGDPRRLYLTEVLYPNLGIAYGMKRSGVTGVGDIEGDQSIGASARWMVGHAPEEMRDVLIMLFIKLNRTKLDAHNVPWFLPESFGGLGIPRPNNKFGQRSIKSDCRLAAAFAALKPRLPKFQVGYGWHVWEYVSKKVDKMKPAPTMASEYTSTLSFDRLCGQLSREAILKGVPLFTEKTKDAEKKARKLHIKYLRRIEKILTRVRRHMGEHRPFSSPPNPEISIPEAPLALIPIHTSVPVNPVTQRSGQL